MNKPKLLSGFRDSLPADMIERLRLMKIIRDVFESYGFDPIETPSLEYFETLAGKEGGDSEMLMYDFNDRGDRHIGLIYDLTVPVSRMIACNQDIAIPFKRYQLQRVWRADRPQKGRFREFHQCDVDIFGDSEITSDAEIIAVISSALSAIGFSEFVIKVSSREILHAICRINNVSDEKMRAVIIEIDKLDKIGTDGVLRELEKLEIKKSAEILEMISCEGTSEQKIEIIKKGISEDEVGISALEQVSEIIKLAKLQMAKVEFDPSLARGQSYYTGPVFEASLTNMKFGSIAGGGRYDKLVGIFSGRDIPAVGASLGFDRILTAMKELELTENKESVTDIYILHFGGTSLEYSLKVAEILRKENMNVMVGFGTKKMKWQMKYAVNKGVKAILIIGDEEVEKNIVAVKDTATREQRQVAFDDLPRVLKEIV